MARKPATQGGEAQKVDALNVLLDKILHQMRRTDQLELMLSDLTRAQRNISMSLDNRIDELDREFRNLRTDVLVERDIAKDPMLARFRDKWAGMSAEEIYDELKTTAPGRTKSDVVQEMGVPVTDVPLSQVDPEDLKGTPTVDPDLIAARKIAASALGLRSEDERTYDETQWEPALIEAALAGIKRGRELAKD